MSDSFYQDAFPCRECQAGMMRLQFMTYFTWLDNELISVPNFPAWICDVCGRREYDVRAISWLNMLLSPNAGKPSSSRRRTRSQVPKRPRRQRPASADN
jgi:YgiT-type zinc finger domain-containing protein